MFLVAELIDPASGAVFHRPPGGGIEDGETAEQAVCRELQEELGITLSAVQELGAVDHTWHWKGREVRERAFIFLADEAGEPRLSNGEPPVITEADGDNHKTVWRPVQEPAEGLPPLCPSKLTEMLRAASGAGD
jgi:8-oxo-dGTP pyrophosphatase MutT (NUDIX family)